MLHSLLRTKNVKVSDEHKNSFKVLVVVIIPQNAIFVNRENEINFHFSACLWFKKYTKNKQKVGGI